MNPPDENEILIVNDPVLPCAHCGSTRYTVTLDKSSKYAEMSCDDCCAVVRATNKNGAIPAFSHVLDNWNRRPDITPGDQSVGLDRAIRQLENQLYTMLYRACGMNTDATAYTLGIPRTTMDYRLRRAGVYGVAARHRRSTRQKAERKTL
jgi:DNA-binding NtrC family response regulator